MRVRKRKALWAAALVLGSCLGIYLLIEVKLLPRNEDSYFFMQFMSLKMKKEGNSRNSITVGNSSQDYSSFKHNLPTPQKQVKQAVTHPIILSNKIHCKNLMKAPVGDIEMSKIFQENKFDDLDGGVWKQGWNIEYDPNMWSEHRKLKVFVVPHSHNDPGWIKTFEDYYSSQTEHILNNMLIKLSKEESHFKFIWAEISFLAMWFDPLNQDAKAKVKRMIDDGKLEIVTGGWVMTDEANSHYSNMLTQLTVGHKWLEENLGIFPRNSWSIDPFGLSPSMAFLLKRSGFENLLIQRVHYSIKKILAQRQQLEFRWRQPWDISGEHDLLTHVMPFYSYDVPHTCGPDPKVCCQFDFKRLPGYGLVCPWKVAPQVITKRNVAARAKMLLDQYRKKSQLYRTNVVLAPLGDDFRYDHSSEWDSQYNNYQMLFDYLNNDSDLHVEARFGTLDDFFQAVREEQAESKFPSMIGDFFTYADRNDHYWSGYFTSRPFHKRMDRVLMSYLRSAEILFALAWGQQFKTQIADWLLSEDLGLVAKIEEAQRHLSLFQHHDGITGTAKDHVVEDYGLKMLKALENCQAVMEASINILLTPSMVLPPPTPFEPALVMDETRRDQNSLTMRLSVQFNGANVSRVVVFNPLTFTRVENVILRVSSPFVQVSEDQHGAHPIHSQTMPVFVQDERGFVFDLVFTVELKPLELKTFTLRVVNDENKWNAQSSVRVFNNDEKTQYNIGNSFKLKILGEAPETIIVKGKSLTLTFNKRGLLTSVTSHRTQETIPVRIGFSKYGTRPGADQSGAYLFLPDGGARISEYEAPKIRVIEGPLLSQLQVEHPGVRHIVTLQHSEGVDSYSLGIVNEVDVSSFNNFELAMRINTDIQNGDLFYTDLNGLSMIRRTRYDKIPLQGNFYPMPSVAFIEDHENRLSVLSGQPLGVGMLAEGELQVMQDRRLMQDDHRGVEQGVQDNRPTHSKFQLLIEKRKPNCKSLNIPSNSLLAQQALGSLLDPLYHFLVKPGATSMEYSDLQPFSSVNPPPQDIHLVSLKTFVSSKQPLPRAGLVLHRWLTEQCVDSFANRAVNNNETGVLDLEFYLKDYFGPSIRPASLTFLKVGNATKRNMVQLFCPMDIDAYLFELERRDF